MFGESHAHLIMDGRNYKAAVALHREGVQDAPIREHLQAWKDAEVTFVRDGGDAYGVCIRARDLAPEYGIDYRTPMFAIHRKGHYGGIVGHPYSDMKEYHDLVLRAKSQGADFIKIMISGIMNFDCFKSLSEEGLDSSEIREMIHIAHEEGMTVMAHGNGDAAARAAVEAGLDTLEHGNYLERDTLKLLAESQTIWVPTLAPIGNLIGCGRFPDEQVTQILHHQMDCIRYGFQRGAHLGLGSDAGAYLVPHGQGLLDEYRYMLEAVGAEKQAELDACLEQSENWIRRHMRHN